MNGYFLLGIITICLFFHEIKTEEYSGCCCYFKKDAFRGFQSPETEIITVVRTDVKTMEDIANNLVDECESKKGILTEESLERIKGEITEIEVHKKVGGTIKEEVIEKIRNKFQPDRRKCERECVFLNRQLNDNYIIEQVKTRNIKAEKLIKEKKRLEKLITEQININVNCLSHGKKCTATVYYKIDKCFGENKANSRGGLSINTNDFGGLDQDDDDDMILDSIGSVNSDEDLEETLKKIKDKEETTLGNTYVDRESYDVTGMDNLQIQDIIQDLKIKILYLQKKNAKPIDYILDRFNIKDNILAMLITLFEETQKKVMKQKRDDLNRYIKYNFV